MTMILEGIRVVDWTIYHVGPAASAMLADLGAEVIHLEKPVNGDLMRGLKSIYTLPTILPGGRQMEFEDLNRNKKSLTLDLRKPESKEIIHRLIKQSDVFLTNLRPSAVEKYDLTYEILSRVNPRLVWGACYPFGEKGPDKYRPSVELIGCARTGAMWNNGEEGMGPIIAPHAISDRGSGVYLAYGIVAALFARERFGIGQKVITSQLSATIGLQAASVILTLLSGKDMPRHRRFKPWNPLYNYYECKDGNWIAFACLGDKYWPVFCKGLGKPELEKDPRFETEHKRGEHGEALATIIREAMLTRPFEEWRVSFCEAGDLLFSKVNRIIDIANDPQVLANEDIIEWDHPVLGRVKFPGFPVKFEKTPASIRTAAPELGQHTEEVLVETCGYSWDEVASLRARGVI